MIRVLAAFGVFSLFFITGCDTQNPSSQSGVGILQHSPTNTITDVRNPESKKKGLRTRLETDADSCGKEECQPLQGGASQSFNLVEDNSISCAYQVSNDLRSVIDQNGFQVLSTLQSSDFYGAFLSEPIPGFEVRGIDEAPRVDFERVERFSLGIPREGENYNASGLYLFRDQSGTEILRLYEEDFFGNQQDGNQVRIISQLTVQFSCQAQVVDEQGRAADLSTYGFENQAISSVGSFTISAASSPLANEHISESEFSDDPNISW